MKIKRYLKRFLITVLSIATLLLALTVFTPYPASYMIRSLFEGGMAIAPDNYSEILARVSVYEDIDYGSNTFDFFQPKDNQENLPVILWVHGGAFVGGDKNDIDEYAVQIADQGYRVVSMNYTLSPEAKYPVQINQMGEIYNFLLEDGRLNLDRFFIAGDSAGAHLAAQFAMIQSDADYARKVDIKPVVRDASTIKGNLLFCGPYDLMQFSDIAAGSKILGFFIDRAAWAYLGQKNWMDKDEFKALSIVDEVGPNFPPSFITDGTDNSFTGHALKLIDRLNSLGVDNKGIFYNKEEVTLQHEYQFQMDNPSSINTFNQMIEFLNQHSN